MTFPSAWARVPITGTYLDAAGNAAVGSVCFTSPLIVTADGNIIGPLVLEADLDADGALAIDLPATDDPDVTPTGWSWTVEERLIGMGRMYSMEVPYGSTGIDLADVAHVFDPVAMNQFITGASRIEVVPSLPPSPDPNVIYITTA